MWIGAGFAFVHSPSTTVMPSTGVTMAPLLRVPIR